jgi:ribonuclease HI
VGTSLSFSKKRRVYTDGGYFAEQNLIKWAWLVVDERGETLQRSRSSAPAGGRGNYDVERAEATAMKEAIDWVRENPGNYVLITDSKSLIEKIKGNCSNATKDPTVPYVRRTMEEFRRSPMPISFELRWAPRRSDDSMRTVDDWCSLDVN